MAEKQKMSSKLREKDDDSDDLSDELEDVKRKNKKLQQQNDDLMRKVQEYKAACESYEMEITQLKNK
jgi:cell division septum initiation protein DivIVA